MLPKLNYTQKNKLLLPLFGIGLLLSWFLAFDKTYDAIKLNHKLTEEEAGENDISFNPRYVQRKKAALEDILKGYQVEENWNDQLWMKGSEIAAKQNVGIDYTVSKPSAESDSTAVGMVQALNFYGNYVQLVRLVDTLERSSRIGKISALQIKAPRPDLLNDKVGKNVMRIDFKGMKKE